MTNQLLSLLSNGDLDLYAHLSRSVKEEAADWFAMVSELNDAENKSAVLRKFAARLNKSVAQCTRKYYEWLNGNDLYPSGDWRLLINRRKAGPNWYQSSDPSIQQSLPPKFIDHLRFLFGRNQRAKCETQYRELLRQWKRWRNGDPTAAIPGYQNCPEPDPDCIRAEEHPRGWSYRNLIRYRQPRVELALETVGIAAALKLLPPVPRTRVGARFLEYVFFDDVWLDRKCIVNGYREPARILQLGCLDYASGVYLKFGQRPELPTNEGTKERLKERDMKWLVAVLLEDFGFPADYDMHLIVERGTATLREPEARALFDLSGGRIKICRTSMEGKLVLSWEERATGNPRGKGPLESWHNLLHNESATMPGQIGKDRDHCPAELFGREKEAINLHAASLILSPEQRARLRLPFPTKEQAHLQTIEIINRINAREDHELEGFDRILLWRIKGTKMEWRPESELLALGDRASALDRDLLEYVARPESPLERMTRLSSGVAFRKFPAGELCRFYEDSHVLLNITEPTTVVEFVRDGKKRRYASPITDPLITDSHFLPAGEYLAYLRPDDFSAIHLTRDGSYVATWRAEEKLRPGDSKALALAIQRKSSLLNHHIGNVRRRHAGALAEREADLRNNLALIAEAGMLGTDAIQNDGMDATRDQGLAAAGTDAAAASDHASRITRHASPLSQAVLAHEQSKAAARNAVRADERLADLADDAVLANIKPDLE